MKAARWHARRDVRVEDVPDVGHPAAGSVRLRVEACGICGTDVEEYLYGPNLVPLEPNPLTGSRAPLTLGHEVVGVIEEAGSGVALKAGTRVAVEANLFCGECYWCQRRQFPLCVKLASMGLHTDGGLAEYMLAPEYMCLPYSDSTSSAHMALAEPLSVAVRAIDRSALGPGDTIAILGAGAIGLLCAQVARAAGAGTVVVIDTHDKRRELAKGFGVDAVATPDEAPELLAELTHGVGPDVTVEAAGNPAATRAAVQLVRKGGRTVALGVYDADVAVPMMDLLMAEKTLLASLSHVYDTDFARAVRYIDEGTIDVAPLITDRIGLDDVVSKGFEALAQNPADHLKVLVFPGAVA
jgi:(R,R)-butanediol dehydrogenase/meso-butanediol dehydrogenase/diacetyl reductase